MSFRIVSTPLNAAVREPRRRNGGLGAGVIEGFLPAPGLAPVLQKLAQPDVLVVTTGQQPALFTGPLYTVHKALSAAALAMELEQRWGRPVVPVFWVAGDDHDWAEARTASWVGADGALVRASLRARSREAPMLSLAREPLGAEVTAAIDLLAATLPTSEHRDSTVAWIRRHFEPERTVAAAAGAALAELLAPFGIACLDSTSAAVKRAAAPTLVAALQDARAIEDGLVRREGELAADGGGGIAVGDGASLVMLEGPEGRDRLVRDGDRLEMRRTGASLTLNEVERIAAAEPARLSANVLLRPVLESVLLPTVAYCAGPAELRYLRLAAAVFDRMGVHRPTPVPRWSGVVVSTSVDRVLEKFGFSVAELLDPAVDVAGRAARDQLPRGTLAALSELRAALASRYDALRNLALQVDPTLGRPFEYALRRSLDALERGEKKLVRAAQRRHETELRQLVRARTAVLPDGAPQERLITAASALAPHGPDVLFGIREAAHRWYAGALEGRPVPA